MHLPFKRDDSAARAAVMVCPYHNWVHELDGLATLDRVLAPFKLDEMRCVEFHVYPAGWNWKQTIENFAEGYHQPPVHPNTFEPWCPGHLRRGCGDLDHLVAAVRTRCTAIGFAAGATLLPRARNCPRRRVFSWLGPLLTMAHEVFSGKVVGRSGRQSPMLSPPAARRRNEDTRDATR